MSTVPPMDPANGAGVQVRLLRVEEGDTFKVRFLAAKLRGMLTHYQPGGSIMCILEGCPLCKRRVKQIWKGYAPVEQFDEEQHLWYPFVLEATEGLELLLRHRNLLGEVWRLTRPEKKLKKPMPVTGTLIERSSLDHLSKPFDVRIVLKHVYHENELLIDVPNPLPDRLYLSPVKGAAPVVHPAIAALEGTPYSLDNLLTQSHLRGIRNGRIKRGAYPLLDAIVDANLDLPTNGQAEPESNGNH